MREALRELRAIRGERPVTAEELELGPRAADPRLPARLRDRRADRARAAQLALYDLPDDYFTQFVPTVLALTPEDLTRAAATHIDPAPLR